MKSKAIFILPPSKYDFNEFKIPSWDIVRIPPIGLMTIGSYLHAKGHNIEIIDCRELIFKHKTNNYTQFILNIVEEFKPEMIGIDIFTALFDEAKNISRELKKPCIIGTQIGTKVLSDGDMVEVDAEKGIVRILQK